MSSIREWQVDCCQLFIPSDRKQAGHGRKPESKKIGGYSSCGSCGSQYLENVKAFVLKLQACIESVVHKLKLCDKTDIAKLILPTCEGVSEQLFNKN